MHGPLPPVLIQGGDAQSGAYLLRIQVAEAVNIVFGRFLGGRPLEVPAGTYIYVGSARGVRGSAALAHRLVRHATRRAAPRPHAIQDCLLAAFRAHRLGPPGLRPPAGKKLFWHVDYLLESPAAALCHAFILRSDRRIEGVLARRLARELEVRVLVKGLGAADTPGATHLLQVPDQVIWWGEWVARLGVDIKNEL